MFVSTPEPMLTYNWLMQRSVKFKINYMCHKSDSYMIAINGRHSIDVSIQMVLDRYVLLSIIEPLCKFHTPWHSKSFLKSNINRFLTLIRFNRFRATLVSYIISTLVPCFALLHQPGNMAYLSRWNIEISTVYKSGYKLHSLTSK